MITKFKLYEAINQNKPEKGDYVVCEFPSDSFFDTELFKYINIDKIGRIVNITDAFELHLIEYEDLPKKYSTDSHIGQRYISDEHIKYWSKSKEELEEFLATKKYNL